MSQVNEAYGRLLKNHRAIPLRDRHEPGLMSTVHPVPDDFERGSARSGSPSNDLAAAVDRFWLDQARR